MISPLNTIQELVDRDKHYPWRVLVVCTLLNQTHGRGVRPMVDEFFSRTPNPQNMLLTPHDDVIDLLRPLGFYNRRYRTLMLMTQDYMRGMPLDRLHGVGPYARDAIMLFVEGKLDELRSHDTWLRPYREWRLAGGAAVEWDRPGHMQWRVSMFGETNGNLVS